MAFLKASNIIYAKKVFQILTLITQMFSPTKTYLYNGKLL